MDSDLKLVPPTLRPDYEGEVLVFDLDDTLYSERDYMISGFGAILGELAKDNDTLDFAELLDGMTKAYDSGRNALEALADLMGVDSRRREAAIREWVQIYREHIPRIRLSREVSDALEILAGNGIALALVTDGRSNSQRAKIRALGLDRFFHDDCIYISGEHASGKESSAPFEYIAHIFPHASGFAYVADNPAKDFLFPNLMGWKTICLLDEKGTNIHPQDVNVPEEYRHKEIIKSLDELIKEQQYTYGRQ